MHLLIWSRMVFLALNFISVVIFAGSLSKSVYDFDDTLISTTAYVQIFKAGSDPKSLMADSAEVQRISTAAWSEVRHSLGQEGQFKDWILDGNYSFKNFSGTNGENAFLQHLKETVQNKDENQWQSPMWDDFATQLKNKDSAHDVYILTARSPTAMQILEGMEFLRNKGYLKYTIPAENIFAVSDPDLRLKSKPDLLLYKERSEVSKALIMQEMLDQLEIEAQLNSTLTATWAFYDDDYANFAKARDTLIPQASQRWPHVQITIGYVGILHENTPAHEVVVLPRAKMTRLRKDVVNN
jgi:hypothetical protein